MQIERRVAGARDRIQHLTANAAVPACVRGRFNARPELEIRRLRETLVNVGLTGQEADRVVDEAVDAVGGPLSVARAEVVNKVDERPVLNTTHGAGARSRRAGSVSAEPGYRVQDV